MDASKTSTSAEKIISTKIKPASKYHFYASLIAGPQFNQVKNQGLNRPGFSGGITAGMRFSKRWSVETGLLVAQKRYASSGTYFKMDKVAASMPAGMKVEAMEGKSNVFEIPIKLKYDIIRKKNTQAFISGGISSYILTNENNQYQASLNGNAETLNAHYSNNKKYVNATVNLSAGYEWKIGKKTGFRIEPYVQIPLKGIGVGSLPVFSTGVHLGIAIPVHR
jgi:hypothetical protein